MKDNLIIHSLNIFSVNDFWDKEICETIIKQAENTNIFPEQETVLIQKNLEDNLDSRDDFRLFLENQELADSIYKYLNSYLDCIKIKTYKHYGVNDNFRIYKYLPGQEFKKHRDGSDIVSETERSLYSLLIYLNDNFEGGSTLFDNCEVKPIQGRATFFPHELEHSGTLVTKGFKYVLRGNIMFKKK
jgi:prolyl 4-hydroxylase